MIDIEALRDHRARAQWDNWMKDLRTELYQILYEQPIYPKNLYLKRAPMKHAEYRDKVIRRQIRPDARPRHLEAAVAMITRLCALLLLLLPLPAAAEVRLPTGFTVQTYVTGEGFDTDATRGIRGIPATSTLTFDQAGSLYLARTGRRYVGAKPTTSGRSIGSPPAARRLSPDVEGRYFYGPPLLNLQVGATRRGRELFVTTFDRERKVGALLSRGRRTGRAVRGRYARAGRSTGSETA